jgi:hypothetical protein
VGIPWSWKPGSLRPPRRRHRKSAEGVRQVRFEHVLFADDTSIFTTRAECENAETAMVDGIAMAEEEVNSGKTEHTWFAGEDDATRFLGLWTNLRTDTAKRIARALKAWHGLRPKLTRCQLSGRKAAQVVESVIGSTLLFGCECRPWSDGDLQKLQSVMDTCFRHLWGRAHQMNCSVKERMERLGVNSAGIRQELQVRSVRALVETRVLAWIGHTVRLPDSRPVKAALLGWMERPSVDYPGIKHTHETTPMYWRRLLRRAGIDADLAADVAKKPRKVEGVGDTVREAERHRGHGQVEAAPPESTRGTRTSSAASTTHR